MSIKILFFARDYQADFFPELVSDRYESVFATLTTEEKRKVLKKGEKVCYCFEEMFDELVPADIPGDYFETSFASDRFLGELPFSDRLLILGKEITFWRTIMEEQNPTAVINETVAIEVSEILYLEAKAKGIRYFSWMSLPVPNTFYWQDTPMNNAQSPHILSLRPGESELQKARNYMAKVKAGTGAPFYAQNLKGRHSLLMLMEFLKKWLHAWKISLKYRKIKQLAIFGNTRSIWSYRIFLYFNSLFFKYRKIRDYEDYELIFYPMHFEPEATLRYMSEFYSNQVAMIENIAKCLKTKQLLVVKEHPQQPGMLLTRSYRQLAARISNVLYVPAEVPTKKVILMSEALVTLTSTAGFEALILGKPVFVMGKVFYNQCPGIKTAASFDELRKLLREEKYFHPEEKHIEHFIAQMVQYAQEGNPYPHQDLYSKTNIRNVVDAIEKVIAVHKSVTT